MGDGLRKLHKENLKTRIALMTYESMCRERRKLTGGLNDHAELIIYNIAQLEDTMEALRADIKVRGEVVPIVNGKQTYHQQNKSVNELARTMDKQARLSAKLGMLGGGGDTAGDEETVESVDDL